MRELHVVGVRVEMPSNSPIVLLREKEGDRYLPIWIGSSEASAIAMAHNGIEPPRPLTHDLLCSLLEALGDELAQVHIVRLEAGVFYAELHLASGKVIESRSSDAIAVALRAECAIYAADDVMTVGGVHLPEEDDEEVEKFREFLDQISPEDFSLDEGGDGDSKPTS